jgi:hypothetical protein
MVPEYFSVRDKNNSMNLLFYLLPLAAGKNKQNIASEETT